MSMQPKSFGEVLTLNRASVGSYYDANGVLQVAASGQPRLTHDPVTKAAKGLLIEESRTNLLTYSSEFGNAGWVKASATVEPAAVRSPDGSANASLLRENTAAGLHYTSRTGFFVEQGKPYTASVFAKSFSGNRVLHIAMFGYGVNIDLGTLEYNTFGLAGLTVVITKAANGFIRAAITATSTTTYGDMYLSLAQNISTVSNNYTGDGTSGIYIWGAQLEAGSFPTSYIPTVASQVTRAADVITLNTGAV